MFVSFGLKKPGDFKFVYALSIYGRNKDNYPIQLSYFVAWILGNNIKYMGVFRPGLIRGGILFLDATYATCSVGLRAT